MNMTKPTTQTGRVYLAVLETLDAVSGEKPVDWARGILAIEAEAHADRDAEVAALREVALIFLRNWHLVARPNHPHDLVDDCDEPLFVRMRSFLTQSGEKVVTCDQVLTDPDGFTARCMVTRGIEHSHHDLTARESIAVGNEVIDGRRLIFDQDGNVVGCPDCWYEHGPSPDRNACSNCDRIF